MKKIDVVTVFLRRTDTGEVLVGRRSEAVGTYRGLWAGISGYLEGEPETQAHRELEEETGLSPTDVRLIRSGVCFDVADEALETRWRVHPFLFETAEPSKVRLDWEHAEFRWVTVADLAELETVPGLAEGLSRVVE